MKISPLAVVAVFGLFLLAAGGAQADSQNICGKLTLSGFNNSSIIAGYRVTDVAASFHQCSAESSSNCSACAGAKSYPKNVGNYLCIPSTLVYAITANCQALLSSGSANCSKNNVPSTVCGSQSTVEPVCNWRTNDNTNEADWNWSLTWSGNTVSVDCSNNNYQGYSQ
ncbi:MAG: hypothetical protein QOH06_457 [Acidobacteriota bacterium]|jgi:hypothetical protein|nr:hypothetical protein [Acidobacteriota bacterium]